MIIQSQHKRNYCGKRRSKARKKLKEYRALAAEATGNYAESMLVDFIACATVEVERWKREQKYHGMKIREYRSQSNG